MILSVMIVAMKRYHILLAAWLVLVVNLCFFLAPAAVPLTSRAEGGDTYAVAITSDVWLYETKNEDDKLFCIPRTYYVKVLSRGDKFSSCEYHENDSHYQKITGYCLTDSLTFVDFTPERPYLRQEITVEYTLPTQTLIGKGKFTSLKATYLYYGNRYEDGQLHFYVCKDGELDYISASKEIDYDLNDDFQSDAVALAAAGAKKSEGLSAVQIVLITLSAVAVLVVAVFVAHGKRSAPPENFEP